MRAIGYHASPMASRNQVRGPQGTNLCFAGTIGVFVRPIPLTPALSPGEREKRRQTVGESGGVELITSLPWLFPLPQGEGQGEGEWTPGVRDRPARCSFGGRCPPRRPCVLASLRLCARFPPDD